MVHVRFAARDPGGANVLAAFLSCCPADVPFTFDVWSLSRARAVFQHVGIVAREFPEAFDVGTLVAAWKENPADALITGTSHYDPFEPLLWRIARKFGCASLAVNDTWINLDPRFTQGRPDFVGAIDPRQAQQLVTLGFDPNQIVVTGHPFLSLLIQRREEIIAATPPISEGRGIRLLFVSECIASDVGKGVNAPFGFDEFDSFSLLHRAASAVARSGAEVRLAVRFHPCEDSAQFLARAARLMSPDKLDVRPLDRAEKPYPWLLWSDLVVGIGSMLLLEAIVLGKPVVSVQPGLIRENTFIAGQFGFAQTLTEPSTGEITLVDLIRNPNARQVEIMRHKPFLDRIPTDSVSPILNWISKHGNL
jgi:hypothetical protein